MSDEVLEPNTFIPIEEQIARVRAKIGDASELRQLYDAALAQLDIEGNKALIQRYGGIRGFEGEYKFLDCAYWIWHKLQIAMELGLHRNKAMRILDIGTGGGHFCFVCSSLGHQPIGTDIEVDVYEDICRLLGVTRVHHRVMRRERLPVFGAQFDLITAFAAQFDVETRSSFWSLDDWRWFVDDLLARQLAPGGKVFFTLNPRWDEGTGAWQPKTYVADVFREYGGFGDGSIVGLNGRPSEAPAG